MSTDDGSRPFDREAYLNEQMARKERGEPVDLDWVREELLRVRREQQEKLAASRKRLLWLALGLGILLVAMVLARR